MELFDYVAATVQLDDLVHACSLFHKSNEIELKGIKYFDILVDAYVVKPEDNQLFHIYVSPRPSDTVSDNYEVQHTVSDAINNDFTSYATITYLVNGVRLVRKNTITKLAYLGINVDDLQDDIRIIQYNNRTTLLRTQQTKQEAVTNYLSAFLKQPIFKTRIHVSKQEAAWVDKFYEAVVGSYGRNAHKEGSVDVIDRWLT